MTAEIGAVRSYENDPFCMMHSDVTCTDTARITLDKVRAFIKVTPAVCLPTQTPKGWQSLENKTVMNLKSTVLSSKEIFA